MMRQWNVVKTMLATAQALSAAALLMAAASPAAAAAPMITRTALHVETRGSGRGAETVLSASVTDATGAVMSPELARGGSVSFETEAGSLGAVPVDDGGEAVLSVTSVPAGNGGVVVRAVYHPATPAVEGAEGGAGLASGSISAEAVLPAATSGVPDFTVTANPASITAVRGQYATTAITIAPQNGFSEQVTLSCANVPSTATCNFSPVIASTKGGAFTSTLEIQTLSGSGAMVRPEFWPGSRVALAWLLPGVLALAGFAARRRKAFGAAALLAVVVLGVGGCSQRYGYNHHAPLPAPGTPAGTYTVTIAASGNDGSAVTVHTLPLTLTVK